MWIIAIVIVLVVVFFYLNAKGNEINKTIQEGGMLKKYEVIIHSIMQEDNRSQITHVSGDQVHIKLLTSGGMTLFILIHNNDHLTIKWKLDSPLYGIHTKKWTFPSGLDQEIIISKVTQDLEDYQIQIM